MGAAKPAAVEGAHDMEIDIEAALARLGGDRPSMLELAQMFIQDCPQRVSEIEAAVTARDPEAVSKACHNLSGTASTLSALGLQELVSYSAFWGGVVVPGLIVTALVVLPYMDRRREGVGVWFARERRVATTLFSICVAVAIALTVIGTMFRGPNWGWVVPWRSQPVIVEGH